MNYLNIPVVNGHSAEMIGADPLERATWIMLMFYCANQETGGRIIGVGLWKERKIFGTLHVTGAELRTESELWTWDGDDICVNFYPADQEDVVRARREAGKKGGQAKTAEKAAAARENGQLGGKPKQNPSTSQADAPTERKEKERNSNGASQAQLLEVPSSVARLNLSESTTFPASAIQLAENVHRILDATPVSARQKSVAWVTTARKLLEHHSAETILAAAEHTRASRFWTHIADIHALAEKIDKIKGSMRRDQADANHSTTTPDRAPMQLKGATWAN